MSGATGATGGNSGNAEKHCSHRDQAHVLSGRKVGISEPLRTSNLALSPGVLAPPKGRMTREGATLLVRRRVLAVRRVRQQVFVFKDDLSLGLLALPLTLGLYELGHSVV